MREEPCKAAAETHHCLRVWGLHNASMPRNTCNQLVSNPYLIQLPLTSSAPEECQSSEADRCCSAVFARRQVEECAVGPGSRAGGATGLASQIVHGLRASRLFQQARPTLHAYRCRPGSLQTPSNSIRTAELPSAHEGINNEDAAVRATNFAGHLHLLSRARRAICTC